MCGLSFLTKAQGPVPILTDSSLVCQFSLLLVQREECLRHSPSLCPLNEWLFMCSSLLPPLTPNMSPIWLTPLLYYSLVYCLFRGKKVWHSPSLSPLKEGLFMWGLLLLPLTLNMPPLWLFCIPVQLISCSVGRKPWTQLLVPFKFGVVYVNFTSTSPNSYHVPLLINSSHHCLEGRKPLTQPLLIPTLKWMVVYVWFTSTSSNS